VPIVFTSVGNPLEVGLVRNLSRPEGNTTGVANMSNEVVPKQMQFLRTILPKTTRVGLLFNPENNTTVVILESAQKLAQQVGILVSPFRAQRAQEIEEAFAQMGRAKIDALIVAADGLFIAQRSQIIERSTKARLPSFYAFSEDAEAGGMMSYGPNNTEVYRRGAVYVDKILKGAKPSDLPVEQPTQFELVLNLKTAATLGIRFPDAMLVQADRVIR